MITRTALAATAALALALPAVANAEADLAAMTGDLNTPIFKTESSLVAEDVNHGLDYYARIDGAAKLLTSGAGTGAQQHLWRASNDGSIAYFRTSDALSPQDTDDGDDLYIRRPSGVEVVAPQATSPVNVVDMSGDGSYAYLQTTSQLLPSDTDTVADIYIRSDKGQMALLTVGTTAEVTFHDSNDEGGIAVFSTLEKLAVGDVDAERDIYWAGSGQIGLLTAGDGPHPAHFAALSAGNGRILYRTSEALVAADKDAEADLYQITQDGNLDLRTPSSNPASAAKPVTLLAASRSDMHRVLFSTEEKLVAGDTDDKLDYYAHDDNGVTLLTPGTGPDLVFEDASTDAEVALISTRDPLMPSDTDNRMDMYRTGDFGRVHVNKTNEPYDEFQGALSPNGVLTAFETAEPVSPADTDQLADAYVLSKSGVKLVSPRDAAVAKDMWGYVEVLDFLATGELLFATAEPLLAEDRNEEDDVYAATASGHTLVTRDDSAPDTLVAAPAQVAPGETFAVSVATTEPGTLECRLDGGDWVACTTGWKPGALAAGTHTIEARATDIARNVDATPATATVTAATPQQQGQQTQTQTGQPPVTVQTPEPPFLPGADAVAPVLSRAAVRVRRRVPTLTFTLSEKAAVTAKVQRRSGGRWKTLRRKTVTGAAGANRVALPKLPRRGTFRVSLIATDAAGNASARLVLRPKRR